jgi:hypothetical protein
MARMYSSRFVFRGFVASALPVLCAPVIAPSTTLAQGAQPIQTQPQGVVYRCPGPTYTNQITPQAAQLRGCKPMEGGSVTIVQGTKPRAAAAPSGAPSTAALPSAGGGATQRSNEQVIDPKEQRARDADARRILESELQREEGKLAEMRKAFANGEPERQGDERNYQRYQERVEEMKQALARKEADVAAIRREIERSTPRRE